MIESPPFQIRLIQIFLACAEIELSIISATAVSKLYPIARNVSIIDAALGTADAVFKPEKFIFIYSFIVH